MTLIEWFKNVDPVGIYVKIFEGDEELFCGLAFDIPYGFIDHAEIGFGDEGHDELEYPIFMVDELGGDSKYADKPGFVINIK